jgi:hypothetical protein
MLRNTQHVVTNLAGDWRVKRGGAERASKVFSNQHDAIAYARALSKKQKGILYIHSEDGLIRRTRSYETRPGNLERTS